MKNIQSLRGMKDLVGEQSELFSYFIKHATRIASNYGFSYIQTPLLEETSLFKRSVGESSDIVNKEMYQFTDKGENDVCLRPEGTAGVVRSFVQNKLDRAGGTHRYFYHGAMYRYERPQKGRLREFHQFGCESFGVDSIYEDANIIMLTIEILSFFGIKHKLLLNSLGCSDCMPKYKENLVEFLQEKCLCGDCDRRLTTNPIRVLDCKNESCKNEILDAPKITNSLCETCDDNFTKLQNILKENGVDFIVDSNLVRGLDYYSGTAFEFISDDIGAQSAIAGGGRYDRLVEFLGGRKTQAIGFAIGIQRIFELINPTKETQEILYIGAMSDDAVSKVQQKVNEKRKNTKTLTEYKSKGFSKHINIAQKLGATKIALIGDDELKNNTIWTKDFNTKEETIVNFEDF